MEWQAIVMFDWYSPSPDMLQGLTKTAIATNVIVYHDGNILPPCPSSTDFTHGDNLLPDSTPHQHRNGIYTESQITGVKG
jgi:hypothetical protein